MTDSTSNGKSLSFAKKKKRGNNKDQGLALGHSKDKGGGHGGGNGGGHGGGKK